MTERLETVLGMFRNALGDPMMNVLYDRPNESLIEVLHLGLKKIILIIQAPKITSTSANWWMDKPFRVCEVDAISVFYGQANELGTLAETSGNRWKPDYRRLSRADDVERAGRHSYIMSEIRTGLTEENIKRLWTTIPLELLPLRSSKA